MPVQDFQGTYEANQPLGYAGAMADASLCDVASRVVENAAVAFGLAVGRGTADGSCRLEGSGFEGITTADKSREADSYAVGEVAGVVRKGPVWVTAGSAMSPGQTVYFTEATGVISSTSSGNTEISNATVETTAANGALVRIHLA